MNKKYTVLKNIDYKGYSVNLKGSYFVDHRDAREAMNNKFLYVDGKEYHSVLLVLEVSKDSSAEMYKESLVNADKGDFKELHLNLTQEKDRLLQYAKDSIDIVLIENEITENLETEISKAAIKQDNRERAELELKK